MARNDCKSAVLGCGWIHGYIESVLSTAVSRPRPVSVTAYSGVDLISLIWF